MCTVAVRLEPEGRWPLLVAANRDEFRGRPFRAPFRWDEGFVAGRDEQAGGTWMGVGPSGLFVALTNLWQGRRPDPAKASRGAVVRGLLEQRSRSAASRFLSGLDPSATNGFFVVVADASGQGFVACTADALLQRTLAPGLHVVGNVLDDHPKVEKRSYAHERVAAGLGGWNERPESLPGCLASALGHHRQGAAQDSLCVHAGPYGTVCASILLWGATRHLWYAHGPPCTSAFEDRSELLN